MSAFRVLGGGATIHFCVEPTSHVDGVPNVAFADKILTMYICWAEFVGIKLHSVYD